MRGAGVPALTALEHTQMRVSLRNTAAAFVAGMILMPALTLAEKVTLRLNLPAGTKIPMTMATDQQIQMEMMGQKMDMTQAMTMGTEYEVLEVAADGTMTIKVTTKSVKMKGNTPMGPMEYDSTSGNADSNPMAAAMGQMIGKSEQMKMSPMGKITMEVPADENNPVTETFEMFNYFPEKPVGVGDTWTVDHNKSGQMPMAMKSTYVVKEIKDGKVLLDVSTVMSPSADGEKDMQGMKVKIDMNGTQKGTMTLDAKTGFIVSSDFVQDISGKTTMSAEGMPEPMVQPMTIKGTVKVTTN